MIKLDINLITNDFRENFKCKGCEYFSFEPKECTKCGALYCLQCFESNNMCCDILLIEVNEILRRLYNSIKLKCVSCNLEFEVKPYINHLSNCSTDVNCVNYKLCNNKTSLNVNKYCSKDCEKFIKLKEKGVNIKNFYEIVVNNNINF